MTRSIDLVMAKLNADLPPFCQVKDRGAYKVVYFIVHPKDRPDGWRASINLGRTDKKPHDEILQAAWKTYEEYNTFRARSAGVNVTFPAGSLSHVIGLYKSSPYYTELAPRTRKDYDGIMCAIDAWSVEKSHPHMREMTRKSAMKFLSRYDHSPRQQKYAKQILSILFSHAIREDLVKENILAGIRLKRTKKQPNIIMWQDADVEKFCAKALELGWKSMADIVMFGYETGQRKGDCIKMQQPRDYENGELKFKQNKTGKLVNIPVTKRLKQVLDAIPKSQFVLFPCEATGKLWDEYHFSHVFRDIADAAGLSHRFKDLRPSAVLNMARANFNQYEISAKTGHSAKAVLSLLEVHYLESRDAELGKSGVIKMEKYRKSHTKSHTVSHTK